MKKEWQLFPLEKEKSLKKNTVKKTRAGKNK